MSIIRSLSDAIMAAEMTIGSKKWDLIGQPGNFSKSLPSISARTDGGREE